MKPVVARQSAFYFLYFLAVSQKSTTFAPVMNWKFILSWAIKFALCTVVFDFALAWTESAWLAFPMALGFLIIIAIIESYVIDGIEKRKNSQED